MSVERVERMRQEIYTEESKFLIDIESGAEESIVEETNLYIAARGSLGESTSSQCEEYREHGPLAINRTSGSELMGTEKEAELRDLV